ncbi:MAG: archease [Gemmatales bacterium]
MHEVFEHTADLGLRIRAASQAELFAEAAIALRELLVSSVVHEKLEHHVSITNSEPALLFFDWLNELLYLFDAEGYITNRATVF